MMMAADSSPPPLVLADATLARVRGALTSYLDAPDAPDGVHAALRDLADEARRLGVPPERLLVVLKQLWHDVVEQRRLDHGGEQTKLLQHVVSVCIEEYYEA